MIMQPQLLRPQLLGKKIRPQILEPQASIWALDFDGISEYVNCGNISIVPPFAVAVEFSTNFDFPSGLGATQAVFGKFDVTPGARKGFDIYLTATGEVRFGWGNGVDEVLARFNTSFAAKTTHTIVGVYDGTKGQIFFDGNFKAQTTAGFVDATAKNVTIGIWSDDETSRAFDGYIYTASIYNCSVSATEIEHLYEKLLLPSDILDLVSWWRFQEGFGIANGTQIKDSEFGQGNHGSMQNFSGDPWMNIGVR